jgi:hypothetical protein
MKKGIYANLSGVLFLFIGVHSISFGQHELQEQITFSSRTKSPIKVEVEKHEDKYVFYGVNSSFLPYKLAVEFTQILNLDPPSNYKSVLNQGRTKLFELRARQKDSPTSYNYKIRYAMGDPDSEPEVDFPYLIPLGPKKKVSIQVLNQLGGVAPSLFKVSSGDTIYAMRKGAVTAIPQADGEIDRLTDASIEIYHEDGTLASYYGVNLTCLTKIGDKVYPGQAIGIMNEDVAIKVNVYRFSKNNSVARIPLKYTTDGKSLLVFGQLNGITTNHPDEVIQRELRKAELKKWEKGSLY